MPERRPSCIRRLPAAKAPVVRTATSWPVTRMPLTFFCCYYNYYYYYFCSNAYLRGQRGLDPGVFSSFLWVSICASTEGLSLSRGFNKNSAARGRAAGDKWSYFVFLCLETPILFLCRQTTDQVTGCPAPQRRTPEEANLLHF